MTIDERIRQLDDERYQWEQQQRADERRAEAVRLDRRAADAAEEGRESYAAHLSHRARHLRRLAAS